ncbi:MAG: hypothetical protein HDR11_02505 [Lachnospiraceae bacterium]|nr:hypothetical protein [Lachnospiraceae bacterium]MBD5496624.1 hypothetical protein [Lachnospiraceae bacterium]MBD5511546.1 hypothetical protein [Lachnospiraceae bacterium]
MISFKLFLYVISQKAGALMAVMDEFKEERANLKNQPFKKKLSYFWTYYKWYVLGGIAAVVFLISIVSSFFNRTNYALYGAMLNGVPFETEETFLNNFMDYAGIDKEKYEVSFNTSLSLEGNPIGTAEFITVYIAARDLDVIVGDPDSFSRYAYSNVYMDLSEALSAEMLAELSESGRIYYIDNVVATQIDELQSANQSAEDIILPDPFKPEEMQEPVPVGVDISNCPKFTDAYYYKEGISYLGIIANTKRGDTAIKLLEFLLSE